MWNWRLFLLNGEARFADIMELIFYNSALSGISLEGKHFFYTNPLRFIQGHPQNTKDEGQRNEFMSVFCCPPNIIRTIAKMHTYAYSISEKGVWVNLYGGNKLETKLADDTDIKLTQETNYPWEGHVKLTVNSAPLKAFSVLLRIPNWARGATAKINGIAVKQTLETGGYVELNRQWKKDDVIELELPLKAQLIAADPNVEETRNQVAVKRGPMVYCLESIDLNEGVNLEDVVIPQDIQFKAYFEKELLSGVTFLEGEAERLQSQDWSNQLYKTLSPQKLSKTTIKLIPYFAWSNRGLADMTVWMPIKY